MSPENISRIEFNSQSNELLAGNKTISAREVADFFPRSVTKIRDNHGNIATRSANGYFYLPGKSGDKAFYLARNESASIVDAGTQISDRSDDESPEVVINRRKALDELRNDIDAQAMTDFMGDEIDIDHRYAWSKYFVKQFRAGAYDISQSLKNESKKTYSKAETDMLQRSYELFCDKMLENKIAMEARFGLNIGPEKAQILAKHLIKKYKRGDSTFSVEDLTQKSGQGREFDRTIGTVLGVSPRDLLTEEVQQIRDIAALYREQKDLPIVAQMIRKQDNARTMLAKQQLKIPEGDFKSGEKGTIVAIKDALLKGKTDLAGFQKNLIKLVNNGKPKFDNNMEFWLAIVDAQKSNPKFLNYGVADGIPNTALIAQVRSLNDAA